MEAGCVPSEDAVQEMAGLTVGGQLDQAFPLDPEALVFQGSQAPPSLPYWRQELELHPPWLPTGHSWPQAIHLVLFSDVCSEDAAMVDNGHLARQCGWGLRVDPR